VIPAPHAPPQPSVWSQLAIYIVIAGIVLFRYSRPMKMSIVRLCITPVVFLVLTVFSIWASERLNPAPALWIAAAVVIGIVLGVPLGIAMSSHRVVRRTEKRHIMYVEPSWVTAVIWIGAFILRAVIRLLVPQGVTATVVGDGLVLFGISAILASYFVIYRKFRALDETSAPAT
jgi:ABC-type proline/glycine betaine transport system permease subunit